jgi:hypothetical protein
VHRLFAPLSLFKQIFDPLNGEVVQARLYKTAVALDSRIELLTLVAHGLTTLDQAERNTHSHR